MNVVSERRTLEILIPYSITLGNVKDKNLIYENSKSNFRTTDGFQLLTSYLNLFAIYGFGNFKMVQKNLLAEQKGCNSLGMNLNCLNINILLETELDLNRKT